MALTTKRHRTARPTPRGTSAGHAYLSQCKLCPYGVFAHQPHEWLTDPIGWSHTDCAQRAGLTTTTAT
ncbi:hypothetical protein AB0N38_18905 [Micromonospora aurantiaca]|uniref:Uncharacterized protein n=1 Tax=Micromonospora aurantiaca (nom. illeg.) TaxID=47850 RepID=A0ABQ6U5N4_9ACTN|nr:hypothetical protein [Micromonospora aurantiaca]KAB1093637.1 hypothetical protein F6X54_34160 [Micromonospora aurantiaca]MBC9007129.1 hypothetical protein [Micromonospora aurantiaca]